MLIREPKWNTQKVHKLIEFLHTAKSKYDPMTHYMKNEMNSEMLYYLLQNPSLFANQYFYQQFIEMYFPEFAKEHPTYTGMLIQMAMMKDYQQRQQRRHQRMYEINYQKLIDYTNKQIRQDKRIKHDLQFNVEVDKLVKNTTRELTEHNERTLEGIIKGLAKQIEKDGLINVPDIKKNKKLQEKLKKYQKQMERENKRLEKNWQNRVLWQKARLLDDKYKPTFKVWDQHPNPKTRHTQTDGQKVKLEEKFIVINDKTGDLDYVDYPGDWTCSPSNSANCLCTLSFTNDPHGYKPHEMLDKEKQKQSEYIIQTNNLLRKLKKHLNRTDYDIINYQGERYKQYRSERNPNENSERDFIWDNVTKYLEELYPEEELFLNNSLVKEAVQRYNKRYYQSMNNILRSGRELNRLIQNKEDYISQNGQEAYDNKLKKLKEILQPTHQNTEYMETLRLAKNMVNNKERYIQIYGDERYTDILKELKSKLIHPEYEIEFSTREEAYNKLYQDIFYFSQSCTKNKIKEPMITFRGQGSWHEPPKLEIGEKIKTNSFTSTSAQLSKVEEWIHNNDKPIIIRYILRKGTPAAPLVDTRCEFDYQCEFTLPPDLEGEIVDINDDYHPTLHDPDYFVNDTATLVTIVI